MEAAFALGVAVELPPPTVTVDGHLPPANARARPLKALALGVGECCAS